MLRPLTALPGKTGLFEELVDETDEEEVEFEVVAAAPFVTKILVAVGEEFFEVEAFAALTNDSAMAVSGGHKFVVCTKPRSKLKQSNTAAPTELRLATIEVTMVHLLRRISYRSTELREEDPSLPPKA